MKNFSRASIRRFSITASVAFASMLAVPCFAGPTDSQKCNGTKLKAAGNAVYAESKCHQKAISSGTAVDGACIASVESKLSSAFGKAEGKGGCQVVGNYGDAKDDIDACISSFASAIGGNEDCSAYKMKTVGKLTSAHMKCWQKGVYAGGSAANDCLASADTKFDAAILKADSLGSCTDTDTVLHGLVADCVTSLVETANATTTTTTTTTTQPASTSGVLCPYSGSVFNDDESVNATSTYSWTCNSTTRNLSANGLPDHEIGTFPNPDCPNAVASQSVTRQFTLTPSISNPTGTSTTIVGYGLNGVKFDPNTAGTCNDAGTSCSLAGGTGTWKIEALGQTSFDFGDDGNHAHVQPGGAYHYHGMPELWLAELGGGVVMRLIGWSVDGFPVYARYGYTDAMDSGSSLKVLTGSWQVQASPDAGRPSTATYPMGTFQQDYEYVEDSGDLDECNGRFGVTPEFPGGIYYYAITDTYPYIQRCIKGTAIGGGPPPP